MSYSIVRPPFDYRSFREMPKKELKNYNLWFHEVIPERIRLVVATVKSTPGYEQWEADYSPDSLEALGEWFLMNAESRPRTQTEIDDIQTRSRYPIDISSEELTDRTFSLAMDIGMYLAQVFLKNHPSLRWSQPFSHKRFIDYGQPVLVTFKTAPFNPFRMMVVLAYGMSSKSENGGRLRELYNIWAKLVAVA